MDDRRTFHPATSEIDYSDDEAEFLAAVDRFKRETGRQFPTHRELLGVLKGLGYVRIATVSELPGPTPRRFARGSGHGRAKLNEAKVARVKERLAAGDTHARIASLFGCSKHTVCMIGQGRSWAHVPWPRGVTPATLPRRTPPKLDAATVALIRAALAAGASRYRVALDFGLSRTTVSRIDSGKTWKRAPVAAPAAAS